METARQSVKMLSELTLHRRDRKECTGHLKHDHQKQHILSGLLLVAISLGPVCSLTEIQEVATARTNNSDNSSQTTTQKLPLDFDALARQLQQDESRRVEAVLKVIGDINDLKNDRRLRALDSMTRARNESKQIIYDDAIQSKRVGREYDFKMMTVSTEGVSKTDEFYFWKVLHNESAVLVVRNINKYYYWDWVQNVGAFILLVIILAGNSSILHRLKLSRRRRSNVNYFIIHLAIADLLVGIFSLTLDTTLRMMKYFPGDLFACQASKFFTNFFIYSSTNLLVALSVDRWEAVVKPLAFTKNRSRGLYLVVGSWVLAAITCLPVTFFMKVAEIEGVTQCWIDMSNYVWRIYMIYLTCLLLIIPTLIIAICYIHIVYTIWSKGRLGVGGRRRALERGDKSSNFSSSFYGASPDSLQQELGSGPAASSRSQARASNRSDDSARLEHRDSSKRISWGKTGRPLVQRANTCESKSACGNEAGGGGSSRRASSEMSAPSLVQTERLAKFKRSSETMPTNDKQGPLGREIRGASGNSINLECRLDGSKGAGGSATSLASCQRNTNNENNNENNDTANLAPRTQANSGCCSAGQQDLDNEAHNQTASYDVGVRVKHRGQVDKQREQMTQQTASEDNNNNNRYFGPVKAIEKATSSTPQLVAVSQRQHKSSFRRVASQGLRILSFARSHSSSSVSSTISTGSTSSSTIANQKSRLPQANAPVRTGEIAETALARTPMRKGSKRGDHSDDGRQDGQSETQMAPALGAALECPRELADEPPLRPGNDDLSRRKLAKGIPVRDINGNHFDLNSTLPKESSQTKSSCVEKPKFAKRNNSDSSKGGRKQEQIDKRLPVEQAGDKFGGGGGAGRDRDFVAQQHGSGVIPKARIKTIKMTLVIVVTYILCWSPFVIVNFLNTFGFTEHNHFWQAMCTCTQTFAHINSAVNPLIFWLFSGKRSLTTAANRNQQTNQPNGNQPAATRQLNKISTNGAL